MEELDRIIEGFEAALELERSLGVRSFQMDRSLLEPLQENNIPLSQADSFKAPSAAQEPQQPRKKVSSVEKSEEVLSQTKSSPATASQTSYDFVFLHHRALSPKGNEMMAKIILAMNRTAQDAPVIIHAPAPNAKAYVVLGSLALKMFFPNEQALPGSWINLPSGAQALVTYSPEYILRFQDGAIAQREIKKKMWDSLKGVMSRFPR